MNEQSCEEEVIRLPTHECWRAIIVQQTVSLLECIELSSLDSEDVKS